MAAVLPAAFLLLWTSLAAGGPEPAQVSAADAPVVLANPHAPAEQRQAAVRALAARPAADDAATTALTAGLLTDPDGGVRFLCARALEHRQQAPEALATALSTDPDARVRRAAARALGRMRAAGAGPQGALIAALKDPLPAVREEAALALGLTATPAGLQALTAATRDPDRAVREQVRGALSRQERRAGSAPQPQAAPLWRWALRHSGGPVGVALGLAVGAAAGAAVPVVLLGRSRTALWLSAPSAAAGGLMGAGAGLGYAAVRGFRYPLTEALLMGTHAASGLGAGVGLGLVLNRTYPLSLTGALGLLGGSGAFLVSAAAAPWLSPRPSAVLAAASGGWLGGTLTVLCAGIMGHHLWQDPELVTGFALVGQGAGVAVGTLVGSAIPVTGVEIMLMDAGAAAGAGLGLTLALATSMLPLSPMTSSLGYAAVLGSMAAGAGAGLLLGTLLPAVVEDRLSAPLRMDLEGLPVTLVPALPTPALNPVNGQVSGVVFPVLSGALH